MSLLRLIVIIVQKLLMPNSAGQVVRIQCGICWGGEFAMQSDGVIQQLWRERATFLVGHCLLIYATLYIAKGKFRAIID